MTQDNRQHPSTQDHDAELDHLTDVIPYIIHHYSLRLGHPILILRDPGRNHFCVMPWSQYRTAPPGDKRIFWHIIFNGTFTDLRVLCSAWPPELGLSIPTDNQSTDDTNDGSTPAIPPGTEQPPRP